MFWKNLFDALESLYESWREAKQRRTARQRKHRRRTRIGEDMGLEDRTLMSSYFWDPSDPDTSILFSNANNFRVGSPTGGRATVAPDQDDTVNFTSRNTANCTVDTVAQNTLGGMLIDSGYTGTVDFQTTVTVTSATQKDGTIQGSYTGGSLIVPNGGTFNWQGGTLTSFLDDSLQPIFDISIGGTAVMNISGTANKTLDNEAIDNNGTISWTGSGDIVLSGTSIINSYNTFNVSITDDNADIHTSGSGDPLLNVGSGALNLTTNHTPNINAPFNNDGTVNVQAGTLSFGTTVTSTGTFNVSQNAVFGFDGSATLDGGSIQGQGTFGMSNPNAVMTIPSGMNLSASVGQFNFYGGTVNGGGTLEVTGPLGANGTAEWGGIMAGTGTTQFASNETVTMGGASIVGRTVENYGVMNWTTPAFTINGGAFTNETGATFDVQGDGTMFAGPNGGTFTNQGTFKKTQGAANDNTEIEVAFNQQGTLQLSAGNLAFDQNVTQTAGQTLLDGGTLLAQVYTIGQGSTLSLTQNGQWQGTIWATELVNDGEIDLSDNGHGLLNIRDNSGQGTGGKYTQTANGTLNMKVSGATTSDQLKADGTLQLNGKLTIALAGWQPTGNTAIAWTLITGSSRMGTFSDTTDKPPQFSVGYGTSSVSTTWTP